MKDLPDPTGFPASLGTLHRGAAGTVAEVVDRNESLGDEARSTLARRLLEIGFVRGERWEIIGETWPGGDPMAVRIGNSTFALRRREANAVLVHVDPAA
jgi:ferrous iron transport protein A